MGRKDKGKGHWVDGVGEKNKKTKQTIQTTKTNQPLMRVKGMERKVKLRRKEEKESSLNQTPNQDRLEVQFSS